MSQIPGPGQYNVTNPSPIMLKPEKFQFFDSSSDRFPRNTKDLENRVMNPGLYSKDTFENSPNAKRNNKRVGKQVPFGASENRFFSMKSVCTDFNSANSDIKSLAKKVLRKNKNDKSVFGSTERRFSNNASLNKDLSLGPGSYNCGRNFNLSKVTDTSFSSLKKSAVFASPSRWSHADLMQSQDTSAISRHPHL